MKIAYILFDGITLLDFIGFYDPIKNIKTLGYLDKQGLYVCEKLIGRDRTKSIIQGMDYHPGEFEIAIR